MSGELRRASDFPSADPAPLSAADFCWGEGENYGDGFPFCRRHPLISAVFDRPSNGLRMRGTLCASHLAEYDAAGLLRWEGGES